MSPQDEAVKAVKECLNHPRGLEVARMVGDLAGALMKNEDIEVQQEALKIINHSLQHKKDYEVAQQKN